MTLDTVLAPLDWLGGHLGHRSRAVFHYLTGRTSRFPLVQLLAWATTGFFVAGTVARILLGNFSWFSIVALGGWLGYYFTSLKPATIHFDRHASDILPIEYRQVRRMGRLSIALLPFVSSPLQAAAALDARFGIPLVLISTYAITTCHWVAIDPGTPGARTLAGDIRRLTQPRLNPGLLPTS